MPKLESDYTPPQVTVHFCSQSRLLGAGFGFRIGRRWRLDVGHLHIGEYIRREARAHALDCLLVGRPLLLQRADHVLHFALAGKEILHVGFQGLDLLPGRLVKTSQKDSVLSYFHLSIHPFCLALLLIRVADDLEPSFPNRKL